MPEDWRTLVDGNLFSINTKMVPQVSTAPQVLPFFVMIPCMMLTTVLSTHICCAVVNVPEGIVHICLDLQPLGPVRCPGLQQLPLGPFVSSNMAP